MRVFVFCTERATRDLRAHSVPRGTPRVLNERHRRRKASRWMRSVLPPAAGPQPWYRMQAPVCAIVERFTFIRAGKGEDMNGTVAPRLSALSQSGDRRERRVPSLRKPIRSRSPVDLSPAWRAAAFKPTRAFPTRSRRSGDLRWRAPQSVAPWSGILVAGRLYCPICVQPDPLGGHSFFTRLFFNPSSRRSEDCLYLNVWTTAPAGDKRPVMVWISGPWVRRRLGCWRNLRWR